MIRTRSGPGQHKGSSGGQRRCSDRSLFQVAAAVAREEGLGDHDECTVECRRWSTGSPGPLGSCKRAPMSVTKTLTLHSWAAQKARAGSGSASLTRSANPAAAAHRLLAASLRLHDTSENLGPRHNWSYDTSRGGAAPGRRRSAICCALSTTR